MKVQESEELVTELALGRLLYPMELTPRFEAMYREYVKEHWKAAGRLLIEADGPHRGGRASLEPGRLPWLVTDILAGTKDGEEDVSAEDGKKQLTFCIEELIALAGEAEDTEMVGWLMDYRHEQKREEQTEKASEPEDASKGAAAEDLNCKTRRLFRIEPVRNSCKTGMKAAAERNHKRRRKRYDRSYKTQAASGAGCGGTVHTDSSEFQK